MGNSVPLDRQGINGVLKNGHPNWLYYPLRDSQSRDLFLLRRKQLGDEGFKIYEKEFDSPVTHISRIGYYNGEVVAFRFENSRKPFLLFKHRNENFNEAWHIIKDSYKNRKSMEAGGLIAPSPLNITFYRDDESDFYWVSSVTTSRR